MAPGVSNRISRLPSSALASMRDLQRQFFGDLVVGLPLGVRISLAVDLHFLQVVFGDARQLVDHLRR